MNGDFNYRCQNTLQPYDQNIMFNILKIEMHFKQFKLMKSLLIIYLSKQMFAAD